jgi:hypothetical protein
MYLALPRLLIMCNEKSLFAALLLFGSHQLLNLSVGSGFLDFGPELVQENDVP